MIFSERDFAALKLLCWCQFVYPEDLLRLITKDELDNLEALLLIKKNEKSGAYLLTARGHALLTENTSTTIPSLPKTYREPSVQRRLRISKLMMTALRASVDGFTMTPEQLTTSPSMVLSHLLRSDKRNPYGSTSVAALAHLGDSVYAIHSVYQDAGTLSLVDELRAFHNQTAQFQNVKQGVIFAGESYQAVFRELNAHTEQSDDRLLYYGQAYRRLQMPIHILSCDDVGAMQMKIMSVPDYRSVFARAALEPFYTPPPKDAPDWDGLYKGVPFVMAADMDLRRINRALQLALDRGFEKIAIVGLDRQCKDLLCSYYRKSMKVEVYSFINEILEGVLGEQLQPYVPPGTQYLTEKGEVVQVPSFRTARKAGGYHHAQS